MKMSVLVGKRGGKKPYIATFPGGYFARGATEEEAIENAKLELTKYLPLAKVVEVEI